MKKDIYTHNQPYYLVCTSLTGLTSAVCIKGFSLMQVLGEGAYAHVYLGHEWHFDSIKGWQQNDKMVAIKLLRHDHLTAAPTSEYYDIHSYGQQCMKDEADFLMRMQKKDSTSLHVPRMKCDGFGTVDCTSLVYQHYSRPVNGRLQSFLIMEYLKGGDLWSVMQQGMVFNELQAYYALEDIFRALRDLHSHGVCHRDLKPDNVAFEEDPRSNPSARLRLIDLGHAASTDRVPYTSVVGTTGWQAPEVVALISGQSREGFDQSIDIYGAGMILGWLLSAYWDPNHQHVRHAPVEHAAHHWMSIPATEIYELCVTDAPSRVSLTDLRPLMKKWRQHLRREAHQEFDNCYRIQPEGRDCRLVAHTEQAFNVFEQLRATLPLPSRLRLSAIALRDSIGSSNSDETMVQTPDEVQDGLELRRFPPYTQQSSDWEEVAASTVSQIKHVGFEKKEKAWWISSLPIKEHFQRLINRSGGVQCR